MSESSLSTSTPLSSSPLTTTTATVQSTSIEESSVTTPNGDTVTVGKVTTTPPTTTATATTTTTASPPPSSTLLTSSNVAPTSPASLIQLNSIVESLESTGSPPLVLTALQELQPLIPSLTPSILKQTGIGILVNKLRKHSSSEVTQLATNILAALKSTVRASTSTASLNNSTNANSNTSHIESNGNADPPVNSKKRAAVSGTNEVRDGVTDGNTAAAKKQAKQPQNQPAQRSASSSPTPSAHNAARSSSPSSSPTTSTSAPLSALSEKPSVVLNNNLKGARYTLAHTGDPVRDNIQKKLHEHIGVGFESYGDLGLYAIELAVRIENVLFEWSGRRTDGKYKSKYRELAMNITDKNNPDLRDDLLSGIVSVNDLIEKPITELASKQLKEARMAEQKELWEARRTDLDNSKGTTDQWRCGKCGERKCTYYQLQTRSSDEPMTTFVRCTNCGNRWKC